MRVGVIGAGPAGLTAAYELSKRDGVHVEVFEASGQVGGLCRTLSLWGQKVDLGPHRFFSKDPRVNALWHEAAAGRCAGVDRLTRIYYGGKFYNYPLKMGNVLRSLGIVEAARCALSYLAMQVTPVGDDATFEGWVTRRFGWRLYEKFFKAYSEKLWGIPCSELDADFAAQRIKKFSMFEAAKAMVLENRGRHATLIDRFDYPLDGAGQVYEAMRQGVEARGGSVRLNTLVRRVVVDDGRAVMVELENGETVGCDHVVSTMPITRLVDGLADAPTSVRDMAGQLRFRNTVLVYLLLDGTALFPDNWIYVHDRRVRCGRITNFRNWVPGLYGDAKQTVVAMEYWCNDGDVLWHEDDASLASLAERELLTVGVTAGAMIAGSHVERLAWSYPVYFKGYRNALGSVEAYLRGIKNLSAIGRYGTYKYNNQDHSMLMGLLAAQNIADGTTHDLWCVNTDNAYHEEGMR